MRIFCVSTGWPLVRMSALSVNAPTVLAGITTYPMRSDGMMVLLKVPIKITLSCWSRLFSDGSTLRV
ncbi:Uncharacterised protein [Klebsiella pneumoniae]|nr:Uncharacterised protein [Klebsiella pneumoniae]